MKRNTTPPLEQVLKAFTYHQLVSITKRDGERLAEGYILIMYGDVAFRIQNVSEDGASHFVSVAEIEEISVREPEPTFH